MTINTDVQKSQQRTLFIIQFTIHPHTHAQTNKHTVSGLPVGWTLFVLSTAAFHWELHEGVRWQIQRPARRGSGESDGGALRGGQQVSRGRGTDPQPCPVFVCLFVCLFVFIWIPISFCKAAAILPGVYQISVWQIPGGSTQNDNRHDIHYMNT